MRKLALLLAALSLLVCAGAAAGALDVRGVPQPPQIPRIPGTWSHAEINVTIRKVPHTLIVDRGKIIDTVDGARGSISNLRRRMSATTLRVDGGVAVRVRATSF
jgi:hypothetical protein